MRAATLSTICLSLLGQALSGPLPKRQGIALATCPHSDTSIDGGYNVTQVMEVGAALAQHSFEYGTHSQALLELYNPELSVFNSDIFPEDKLPTVSPDTSSLTAAIPYIQLNSDLLGDSWGHPANPATLGIAAIQLGQSNTSYMTAATSQINYLLNSVPRIPDGAIATNEDAEALEVWSEWLWEAPPFLAYYAVATNNASLLNLTITQISLYRDHLRNNTGPDSHWWLHVAPKNTSNADHRPWSSGNGYVVAGLARVLATTMHWASSATWSTEQTNLKTWIREITDALKGAGDLGVDDSGLILNYLPATTVDTTGPNRVGTFGEVTGTALMVSAVYRMLVLAPDWFQHDYQEWADQLREGVANHWYSNGVLSPSVEPYNASSTLPDTSGSAQGQNAGGLLFAAYRDCVCAGFCWQKGRSLL